MWEIQRVETRSRRSSSSSDNILLIKSPPSLYFVTAFHATVVVYYIIMNVFMGIVSMRLYEAGHPITKMFLGGVTQFFTTWNQVFQQTYFVLSLVEDLMGFSTCKSHALTRQSIAEFKRRLFGPILMPSTCLTLINFWSIYYLVPHLMLDDLVAFYPAFLNHVMHTFIVPLGLLEMIITPQANVKRSIGFRDVTILMAVYAFWVYLLGMSCGQWPYPFLEVMNFRQHLVFIPSMFIHGYFWYFINDFLIRKIWGVTEEDKTDLKVD